LIIALIGPFKVRTEDLIVWFSKIATVMRREGREYRLVESTSLFGGDEDKRAAADTGSGSENLRDYIIC
jgi:hypothetical protein